MRPRRRAGQERQKRGHLLAGDGYGPVRPAQFETAKQHKLKSGRWQVVHVHRLGGSRQKGSRAATLCNFHGRSSKIHARVTSSRSAQSRLRDEISHASEGDRTVAQFPSNVDRSNPLLHVKRPLAAGGTRALRAWLPAAPSSWPWRRRQHSRRQDGRTRIGPCSRSPATAPGAYRPPARKAKPSLARFANVEHVRLEPSDCGAVQLHYKLGWAMAVLCGHHRVMVTAEDREAVEALAIERIAALGQIHGDLPSCRHLLTVDPVGAVTAAKTPSR